MCIKSSCKVWMQTSVTDVAVYIEMLRVLDYVILWSFITIFFIISNITVFDFFYRYVLSHMDEVNTTPSVGCGVLMALRLLKHLCCLTEDSSTDQGWLNIFHTAVKNEGVILFDGFTSTRSSVDK